MTAANAGAYSVADIAAPARTQAAKNHGKLGAAAMASTAVTATAEPTVITVRGPAWSMRRPTHTPHTPDVTSASVNAATSHTIGQSSTVLMLVARTGKA